MGTNRKVLRKLATKIEGTPGTYQEPDTLIPFLKADGFDQKYDMIEDQSIVGVAHKDLPVQGVRHVEASLESQADVITLDPLLQAAFGYVSSKVYTFPATVNEKSLTFFALDEVKSNILAGCYCKEFKLGSNKGEDLRFSASYIGYTLPTRDATAFPTMTYNPGTRIVHHHASGTGYFRVGDQADALTADDNIGIDSWEISGSWGFDEQYDNTGKGTLQPLSMLGKAELAFKVSRHTTDTLLAARDAATAMQAQLYFYVSATASILIRVPNFRIFESNLTDDEIGMVDIKVPLARNGIGTTYSNSNTGMTFVSPIQLTIDNA